MLSCGLQSVSLDYAILNNEGLVAASFFDRSLMQLRSVGASLSSQSVKINDRSYAFAGDSYEVLYSPVVYGKEKFYHAFAMRAMVNKRFFLSTVEQAPANLYHFLMHNFELPLMYKWKDAIYEMCIGKKLIAYQETVISKGASSVTTEVDGVRLEEIRVYSSYITEESLKSVIQELFEDEKIWIAKEPQRKLEFSSMDDYFKNYGHTLVKNLENQIEPLEKLNGNIDTIAFNNIRLYPQQIAQVNGVTKMLLDGYSPYAILNMGMGTGKTICSIGITENLFISKYLRKHPRESVKDVYSEPDKIKYRNIVMCPGHLVKKWEAEIKREVPYASVEILTGLSQLVKIKSEGKERTEKKWYIIGKDTAKLSYQSIPVPTRVRNKYPVLRKCCTCDTVSIDTRGEKFQCECGGNVYTKEKLPVKVSGMICPSCGELLLPNGRYKDDEEYSTMPLMPHDFANPSSKNERCHYCGEPLWRPHIRNINVEGTDYYEHVKRNSGWHRATHYANKTRKSVKSVWVHKDFEEEYYYRIRQSPLREKSEEDRGIRKYALASYIKKQLSGYFDMFIIDEAHLFKGGATAQGNAMHSLVKASKYQLALTGTIAGGMATDMFYLLYRLEPARMKAYGYKFTDELSFAKKYGTIETAYSCKEDSDNNYNQTSRGKQLSSPRVKPGISPLIFRDFLLDRTVFLDLSDMSKFLPVLKEQVVSVSEPREIEDAEGNLIENPACNMLYHYRGVIENLKSYSRQGEGRGVLGRMLQFSLSYPDHPYGVTPIKSPFTGQELQTVEDYSCLISDGKLLAKERKLVEIVSEELRERRNCVIYVEFSKSPETCVSYRLKEIIEQHCELLDKEVVIIESSHPAAAKREEWMHKKASEGAKVFIVQPKCVETGLDFCWIGKDGKLYNYPTLIFYQIGYSLYTFWQASKRSHRLNQREECRNYYMATAGTLQEAVIRIIAEKQVATSAIQGKFSTEGIAAVAQGVDVKVRLAQAMADMDHISGNGLQEMFDVLNTESADGDEIYSDYTPMKTFKELVGDIAGDTHDTMFDAFNFNKFTEMVKVFKMKATEPVTDSIVNRNEEDFVFDIEDNNEELKNQYMNTRSAKKMAASGQLCLFDL